ncbi:type VI secretion system-associated protein [Burkholderia sp. THE68]|uniref:type VI secretion system baseplate subunit TssK n=1 Tax=Burkholderia sp. THE68 TaxID=758782 RepID=UPI001317F7BD|nr:type VI secretion system baseplate subunit TssK [Burkholderia sp. THE68]BBU31949.1 type VI secretion system-associated protein [Burkholderia sp. THE68]
MSLNNKVIWSEGMFLQPQHLQQQDRYQRAQLTARCAGLRPFGWGFTSLKIDEPLLALGKLALRSASGVLPDGTPFDMPASDSLPEPLDIPDGARDTLVVLALPLTRPDVPECENVPRADSFARHCGADLEVRDSSTIDGGAALLRVGRLCVRLALAPDVANGYTSLGVVKVMERLADNRVLIDEEYAPPCLDFHVAPHLAGFVDDLVAMLHQRGESLAGRLAQPGTTGAAEVAELLFLQAINRAEPLLAHLAQTALTHPDALYRVVLQLAGELSTFSKTGRRPPSYPVYRHDQLKESFAPVIEDLCFSLRMADDARAVPIPLEERRYGVRVADVADKTLYANASFVLAVHAHMPAQALLTGFAPQVQIGPIERIRDLVNLHLPGIGLQALPVAPRELPFHAGYTYFALDGGSELWQQLPASAGLALFVAGDFPGLAMQMWAIRN